MIQCNYTQGKRNTLYTLKRDLTRGDFMTIEEFAKKNKTNKERVKKWIKKDLIPGADIESDFIPNSAKPPYTRAKAEKPASVLKSIVKATAKGYHVMPSLYNKCPEEFESYINQLVKSDLIAVRETDGITYYDPTVQSLSYNEKQISDKIKLITQSIAPIAPFVPLIISNIAK